MRWVFLYLYPTNHHQIINIRQSPCTVESNFSPTPRWDLLKDPLSHLVCIKIIHYLEWQERSMRVKYCTVHTYTAIKREGGLQLSIWRRGVGERIWYLVLEGMKMTSQEGRLWDRGYKSEIIIRLGKPDRVILLTGFLSETKLWHENLSYHINVLFKNIRVSIISVVNLQTLGG